MKVGTVYILESCSMISKPVTSFLSLKYVARKPSSFAVVWQRCQCCESVGDALFGDDQLLDVQWQLFDVDQLDQDQQQLAKLDNI